MQPSSKNKLPELQGDKTYLSVHQKWFTEMYKAGIDKTREKLVDYAKFMLSRGLDGLNDEITSSAIKRLADGPKTEAQWRDFCPNSFEYPAPPL